jgi:hypothetical protein
VYIEQRKSNSTTLRKEGKSMSDMNYCPRCGMKLNPVAASPDSGEITGFEVIGSSKWDLVPPGLYLARSIPGIYLLVTKNPNNGEFNYLFDDGPVKSSITAAELRAKGFAIVRRISDGNFKSFV